MEVDGTNHKPMATAQSRGWVGRKPECEVATLGTHGAPDSDGFGGLRV